MEANAPSRIAAKHLPCLLPLFTPPVMTVVSLSYEYEGLGISPFEAGKFDEGPGLPSSEAGKLDEGLGLPLVEAGELGLSFHTHSPAWLSAAFAHDPAGLPPRL